MKTTYDPSKDPFEISPDELYLLNVVHKEREEVLPLLLEGETVIDLRNFKDGAEADKYLLIEVRKNGGGFVVLHEDFLHEQTLLKHVIDLALASSVFVVVGGQRAVDLLRQQLRSFLPEEKTPVTLEINEIF